MAHAWLRHPQARPQPCHGYVYIYMHLTTKTIISVGSYNKALYGNYRQPTKMIVLLVNGIYEVETRNRNAYSRTLGSRPEIDEDISCADKSECLYPHLESMVP